MHPSRLAGVLGGGTQWFWVPPWLGAGGRRPLVCGAGLVGFWSVRRVVWGCLFPVRSACCLVVTCQPSANHQGPGGWLGTRGKGRGFPLPGGKAPALPPCATPGSYRALTPAGWGTGSTTRGSRPRNQVCRGPAPVTSHQAMRTRAHATSRQHQSAPIRHQSAPQRRG